MSVKIKAQVYSLSYTDPTSGYEVPFYHGMTTIPLARRFSNHMSAAKNSHRNEPVLKKMREVGTAQVYMTLISSHLSESAGSRAEQRLIRNRTDIRKFPNGTNVRRS